MIGLEPILNKIKLKLINQFKHLNVFKVQPKVKYTYICPLLYYICFDPLSYGFITRLFCLHHTALPSITISNRGI